MFHLKKLLLLLPFIALFASCRPEPLDKTLPEHKAKLVVNSQFIPPNMMLVSVTRSFSALTGQTDSLRNNDEFLRSLVVDHGRVTLTHNGTSETLTSMGNGFYIFSGTGDLNAYTDFALHVHDSTTKLECTAQSTLLPQVTFEGVKPEVVRTAEDTSIYLHFSIRDTLPGANYYLVDVIRNTVTHPGQNRNPFSLRQPSNYLLFTDEKFTNGRYVGKERLHVSPNDTVAVMVANISKEYYEFLQVYKRSGSLFNQLTGEPLNFPSNVSNGYGFFTMHQPEVRFFNLAE